MRRAFARLLFLFCLVTLVKGQSFSLFGNDANYEDNYDEVDEVLDGSIKFQPEPEVTTHYQELKDSGDIIEVKNELLKNIGKISDLNELQMLLGIEISSEQNLTDFTLELRSREKNLYLENPQQAHCEPELQSIDLGLQNSRTLTYYPTCVRVKRCGGCCPSKGIISCQPTASAKVIVKVLQLDSNPKNNALSSRRPTRGGGRRRRNSTPVEMNYINVTVEEHKECACLCRTKEADCDLAVQIYDQNSCSCICKNTDEREKCFNSDGHYWNKDDCSCLCRKTTPCSTSETFDHATCSCVHTKLGISFHDIYSRRSSSGDSPLRKLRKPVPVPFK